MLKKTTYCREAVIAKTCIHVYLLQSKIAYIRLYFYKPNERVSTKYRSAHSFGNNASQYMCTYISKHEVFIKFVFANMDTIP